MCEFCLDPSGRKRNSDSYNRDFEGFFSTAAIEQAVTIAKGNDETPKQTEDDEDEDGT